MKDWMAAAGVTVLSRAPHCQCHGTSPEPGFPKLISQVALAWVVSAEGPKGVEECAAPCAGFWAGVLHAHLH